MSKTMALISLVTLAAIAAPAHATTVEPKVQLIVRERPSNSARIVDRVPAGTKLPLLGRSTDGTWTRVQTEKRDGWVPTAQLKGGLVKGRKANLDDEEDPPAEDEEPARPLAKRRNVRPEAWVSKSRYHDGEDSKLIVSAVKAEMYGRPSTNGSVLGILRRGDQVSLVRKSTDKKWALVDIGGGEVAWIEAKAFKPGAARGPISPDEADGEELPPTKPRKLARVEPVNGDPDEEPAPKPTKLAKAEVTPEPAPAPKKSKKDLEREAEEAAERQRALDDEAPPGMAVSKKEDEAPPGMDKKKKKKKKDVKVASRSDVSVGSAARVSRQMKRPASNNHFSVGVRGGFAIVEQSFRSNAMGILTNYDAQGVAFGAQLGLGYARQIGKYFRLGLDASGLLALGSGYRYVIPGVGTTVELAMQNYAIDAGISPGVHFDVIGGLNLSLRVGAQMQSNLIQGDTRAPLPSEIVLGMTVGIGLAAPALFHIAGRPFGLYGYAGGLVPAMRIQTPGLEEGTDSQTYGATWAVGASFAVAQSPRWGNVALNVGYNGGFALTSYTGMARRNTNITQATRGSALHLVTLGISYNY